MFSEKKKSSNQVLERNIISKNTSFTGEINSEGDFRIDGIVEGTINTTGRVVIGAKGIVKGTVTCTNADVEGIFEGKLIVEELLSLKATSTIEGEVYINKLSVEPNAIFNATCTMKSGIKELKANDRKASKKNAS